MDSIIIFVAIIAVIMIVPIMERNMETTITLKFPISTFIRVDYGPFKV